MQYTVFSPKVGEPPVSRHQACACAAKKKHQDDEDDEDDDDDDDDDDDVPRPELLALVRVKLNMRGALSSLGMMQGRARSSRSGRRS